MPRKFFKRHIPHPDRIRKVRSLQVLGQWIYEPNLWHINRYSASIAFFIGLFCAFIPLPGQMVFAAIAALWLRANLPLSIALVWVSNPLTMPPIFYSCYKLGSYLLQTPELAFEFEASWQWLNTGLVQIWQPFLLGCFIFGLFFGLLGYLLVSQLWRMHVLKRWTERKNRHKTY
ncbi:DUF2062 domain-containing protein [Halieaceae bacterium]|nr:DUF2062 domain-containing protein [Halieaceae bacterium]